MFANLFRSVKREDPMASLLPDIPLFEGFSRRELREIEAILKKRTADAGEVIFQQEQPGVGMYILISGAVEVFQEDESGSRVTLTRVTPGCFFGEMSLLDDAPRTASAVASEASELAVFYRSDLLNLAEQRPQLGVKIVMHLSQVVADRLRRTNRALKEVRAEVEAVQLNLPADTRA